MILGKRPELKQQPLTNSKVIAYENFLFDTFE